MESLLLALLDADADGGLGPRVERLLGLGDAPSDVLIAVKAFVQGLFRPRNAAAAGGFAATLATILSYRWWKYGLLALFTRILPPRVLDQKTRARIFEFIEQHPGARAQRLVNELGLATGQAMHHLYILEKQGLITRTGAPLAKRYFVRGRLSPQEMQKTVIEQNAPLAGLQAAVKAHPGATIAQLATTLDLSPARVSRMSRLLAQAGAVERVPQGRIVRLYPKPH